MNSASANLEGLIRGLRPCQIAVIGDVMLDHYVQGRADRLSPEAPIPILDVAEEYRMPGGAANVAMKALSLGAQVRLVGLVGVDPAMEELRGLLAGQPHLSTDLIADPGRATTVKTRFIAQNQQLLRVDRERRAAPTGTVGAQLARAARQAAAAADAVILEDYGKGVLGPEVIAAALEGAAGNRVPVVVDPSGHDYRRFAGTTVLTPNLKEAALAAECPIIDLASLEVAAARLVEQTVAAVAITRDADGISLFRRERPDGPIVHTHVPTVPVAVYDVTGAGDAVAACLAVALVSGTDLIDACALANLAGRAVVRQFGVGTISITHLLTEARSEAADGMSKVADLAAARQRTREVQRAGGKVVFTNGCFDILHSGHARLLQFARSLGGLLVLGLNTDASVRRFKGADRPIVPQDQRAYLLSLFPFIDLIVLYNEDTPMHLIEAIRPDVLVKGGDYTPEAIVGRDFVESYGGRVVIFPRLEGLSTTEIVRRIRRPTSDPDTDPSSYDYNSVAEPFGHPDSISRVIPRRGSDRLNKTAEESCCNHSRNPTEDRSLDSRARFSREIA
jgi:D-beta-D-heptose 7-phosphate kinase/D-beta-D-heptose 1-phosphate adenosyltransferase